MKFGKVAVLAGGDSAEREVSQRSGAAVHKALVEQGVDAFLYDPAERGWQDLLATGAERVFIALHGRGGEDGQAQAILEMLGLPYTGSGVLASALAMDKGRTKALWRGVGLPTAQAVTVKRGEHVNFAQLLADLGGQVMVKPAHEGSSIGMAMADSADALAAALAAAADFDHEMLVETWLSGPEYTVGIVAGEALPAIRVKTPHAFYDYAAKYQDNTTEYLCPAGLSVDREAAVRALALEAFAAVGAEGWGRVDLMENSRGELQLLELNTVPGMTEKSLVPKAAAQLGMSFGELVVKILSTTLPAAELLANTEAAER
ncbi:MAG: D-alanine--D-alanine ligase [Gammaproteobacteria bacterium]|nr:D-alanine--D-alanine ligase [Gammaproteobacteria bacterium]